MSLPAQPRFSTVRWREGYSMPEVDAFLDEVEPWARSPRPPAGLAKRIREAVFTPVRLRPGYDMSEVDEHLDRLAALAPQG